MLQWFRDTLIWLTYIFNELVTYFKDNEAWLSGMGNFFTIILALVTILGFFLGWWKRFWRHISRSSDLTILSSTDPSFPFDVIKTRKELLEHLYPKLTGTSISDLAIPYIHRSVHKDVQKQMKGHRKLILAGKSNTGKTRAAAEIAAEFITRGYIVLLLKPFALLDRPFQVPDFLAREQVIIFVDSIEKYLGRIKHQEQGRSQSATAIVFGQRLLRAIAEFESIIGSNYVRFLGTTRTDVEVWAQSGYSETLSRWNGIRIEFVGRVTKGEAGQLVSRLSKMSGITVSQDLQTNLAEKNDGEFQSLIVAFRQWRSQKIGSLGHKMVQDFSADIDQVWQQRYLENIRKKPSLKYAYAAIDVAIKSNIPPYYTIIESLTHYFRYQSLPLTNAYNHNAIVRIHARPEFDASTLMELIIRLILIPVTLYRLLSVQNSLSRLKGRDIPYHNDCFRPYDGQVDDCGLNYYDTPLAVELISNDDGPIRRALSNYIAGWLSPNIKEAYQNWESWLSRSNNSFVSLIVLHLGTDSYIEQMNVALRLNPKAAYLYHFRADLSTSTATTAALADIEKAIALDAQNKFHYICAARIYVVARDYHNASRVAEIFHKLNGDVSDYNRAKAHIYDGKKMYGEALTSIDAVVSSEGVHSEDYIFRALILERLQAPEKYVIASLKKALQGPRRERHIVWDHIAQYYARKKSYAAAAEAWSRAIHQRPQHLQYYISRAQMFSRCKNKARVLADCATVDKLARGNTQVTACRARLDFLDGRYKECKEKLEPIALSNNLDMYGYVTYTATLYVLGDAYQRYVDGFRKWSGNVDAEQVELHRSDLIELINLAQQHRPGQRLLDMLQP